MRKSTGFWTEGAAKRALHQVIVIVILADRVEEQLRTELSDTVGKGGGDGSETAALPCVVDLERRSCVRQHAAPLCGLRYPVKNRGIRLIRRYLFGGRFPMPPPADAASHRRS